MDILQIATQLMTQVADKIAEYASALNINTDSAQDQLAKVVPQMVDKSSSGGQLNDA